MGSAETDVELIWYRFIRTVTLSLMHYYNRNIACLPTSMVTLYVGDPSLGLVGVHTVFHFIIIITIIIIIIVIVIAIVKWHHNS